LEEPWISNRRGQFSYFDRQLGHPDWSEATVLDFGGNVGNILLDPGCTIDPRRYWCLDIEKDAIAEGQQRHPLAHFAFYDRYNFEFNPCGTPELPVPDLGQRFDIIVAYSVFSHTSRGEMLRLVEQLRALLTDSGALAFTFIDPLFDPPEGWARDEEAPGLDNLNWVLRLNGDASALATGIDRDRLSWATFVNNDELVTEPGDAWLRTGAERSQYLALCTEEHMRSIYPEAEVHAPVRPERQSCCVIRNRERPARGETW
jgi:SAM-dependent methyltransferase